MSFLRRLLAIVVILALGPWSAGLASAQQVAEKPPGQDNETMVITGHGWGHGRGMSQYGSAGYAVDFDWTSDEILDHYYGDTQAGTAANQLLTVRLEGSNEEPTVAAVDSGAIVLMDTSGAITRIGTGRAVRLTSTESGFVVADAPSCAGPFTDRNGVVVANEIRISSASTQPSGGVYALGDTSGSTVVVGDWDGDGDDDLGLVTGSTWKLWTSGPDSPQEAPDFALNFGDGTGTALVGDWNGDGVDTPTVFDEGGDWAFLDALASNASTTSFVYGINSVDVPIIGDWDGDGDDDAGVRRGTRWLLRTTDFEGNATHIFSYGLDTDVPVVGDWDGDGSDDPGFARGRRVRRKTALNANGGTLPAVQIGASGSQRLPGDWNSDGIHNIGFLSRSGVADLTGPLAGLAARTNPNLPLDQTIQLCESQGVQRYYRGELRAVANSGNQRTVNAVPLESYLRSVVPLEMPASWALLGGGAGAAAVEVQSVAARSYSLGEDRSSYARTCDTISCQVYAGRAVRRDGTLIANENPLSDTAIRNTAGVIRERDGKVARTEFSSSTGGWTAGGVFPAVEDLGDAIDINPNHDWTIEFAVSQIESYFSGRELDRALVTERNGLGSDGGRVLEITFTFGAEVFTMTGNEFRRAFGLKSDWYTVDWKRSVQRTECICPEDWPDHGLDDNFAAG